MEVIESLERSNFATVPRQSPGGQCCGVYLGGADLWRLGAGAGAFCCVSHVCNCIRAFLFFFERSSWKGGEETPEASPRRLPKKVSLVLGFRVPKLRVPQPQ